MLNHSPALIAQKLLILGSVGTDVSANGLWPVYAANEPPSPDNCITCYDTAGIPAGRTSPDGETVMYYGLQIRVRANNYGSAMQKASQIGEFLDEVYDMSVTIGSDVYTIHAFISRNAPIYIGKQIPASKLDIVTINVNMVI